MADSNILFGILIFLAVLTIFNIWLPPNLQFYGSYDFLLTGASILTVAAVCAASAATTGVFLLGSGVTVPVGAIACGAAVGGTAILNIVMNFILPLNLQLWALYFRTIFIEPMNIMVLYIVAKMGRGAASS